MNNPNLFVVTGGPGAGKTTVIQSLLDLGFQCSDEVGRGIIKSQMEKGGDALPWKNKIAYRDVMLAEELRSYRRFQDSNKPVFFDRGLVDIYCYSKLEGLEINDDIYRYCEELRYNATVCIFPPWRDIFLNDAERKQDFQEAIATHDAMVKAYAHFGYRLLEVPAATVGERVDFILSSLKQQTYFSA